MPNMPRRDSTPASVTQRALTVLDAFGADHPRLTLTQLAARSGLPVSTTSRLIRELVGWGALVRDVDQRFRIGPRLMQLALVGAAGARSAQQDNPTIRDTTTTFPRGPTP